MRKMSDSLHSESHNNRLRIYVTGSCDGLPDVLRALEAHDELELVGSSENIQEAAAALAGIYGNDEVEAMYPIAFKDIKGAKLDGSKSDYTITFPPGELPPVNAFWSVTMYDGKTQLLVANPINRYLINSPMLPGLRKNSDGSLTIYVQKEPPGKDKESNWLPAPDGRFYLVMRLYWPKNEALDGKWSPPAVIAGNK